MPNPYTAIATDIHNIGDRPVMLHPEWMEIAEKMPGHYIDSHTELVENRQLLEVNGVRCFPRGDLVAISGKEKCGKTTVCRIIASAMLSGAYDYVHALEPDLRILWIDTEQARISTRSVSRAIDLMTKTPQTSERIRYINLRDWEDLNTMIPMLRFLFDSFRPDMVVLDGIRDFIEDFNSIPESNAIVKECMHLSSGVTAQQAKEQKLQERMPCCIACILHQNKPKDDSNMLGHLGSTLTKKAGEVWEAMRDEDGLFSFEQTHSRTRPVDTTIAFKVHSRNYIDPDTGKTEELGIPVMWVNADVSSDKPEPIQQTDAGVVLTRIGSFPKDEKSALWLFWNVMRSNGMKFEDLKREFCQAYNVHYTVFNELRAMIRTDVVAETVDGKKVWFYKGPSYYADDDRSKGGD